MPPNLLTKGQLRMRNLQAVKFLIDKYKQTIIFRVKKELFRFSSGFLSCEINEKRFIGRSGNNLLTNYSW